MTKPARPAAVEFFKMALLAVLIALAFSPALKNDFVNWDDPVNITEVRAYQKPDVLHRIWCTREMPSYLPVTDTVWWLETLTFGVDEGSASGFHFVSMLLHFLSSWMLYGLLCEFTTSRRAFVVVLLAAVHPWRVENVAWATEQKSLLAALFAWAAWRVFRATREPGWRRPLGLSACFVLYVGSLLSKPQTVGLPLLMLWGEQVEDGPRWPKRHELLLLIYLVIGLGISAYQSSTELAGRTWPPGLTPLSPLNHVLLAGRVMIHYAVSFVAPSPQSLAGPPADLNSSSVSGWLSVGICAALLLTCLSRHTSVRRCALWILGYLVLLAPASGLFPMPFLFYSCYADRYTYFSLPFLLLLLWELLSTFEARATRFLGHVPGRLWNAGPICLIALWTAMCRLWCPVWSDSITLWSSLLATAQGPPRFVAYNNLGTEMVAREQVRAGIAHYEAALAIFPEAPKTLVNLARALVKRKEHARAIRLIHRALRLTPLDPDAHNALGIALVESGDRAGAAKEFARAIAIDPDFTEARHNAATLARTGKVDR
jgi:hypothetical protein